VVVPFEKNRIVNQARKYTLGQLLDFYDKLLTVEYTIKSGQTSAPLELQLEVLLASWRTEEKCT
jgi:DNA polymerase III delta subunit